MLQLLPARVGMNLSPDLTLTGLHVAKPGYRRNKTVGVRRHLSLQKCTSFYIVWVLTHDNLYLVKTFILISLPWTLDHQAGSDG